MVTGRAAPGAGAVADSAGAGDEKQKVKSRRQNNERGAWDTEWDGMGKTFLGVAVRG